VTDGDTADPALATSNVEIAYNQVVGCVSTGIALAKGRDQIAHDNTVVSAGMTPAGVPYAWAWLGICIEGDRRYQPAEWLEWMQLQNNVVGPLRTCRPKILNWSSVRFRDAMEAFKATAEACRLQYFRLTV
jgi:hypothetical protein